MSTTNPISAFYAQVKAIEAAALASTVPEIKALATSGAAFASDIKAAVGPLAALAANAAIDSVAKAEPVFGILVPLEAVIDPMVSGVATTLEGAILNGFGNVPLPGAPK